MRKINILLLSSIAILAVGAAAYSVVSFGSHQITGRYVLVKEFNYSPVSKNLTDVISGETVTWILTITNPNAFNVSATWVSNEPAFIVTQVAGWTQGTARRINAGQSITVTIIVQVGIPSPNVDQKISYNLSFYGDKV